MTLGAHRREPKQLVICHKRLQIYIYIYNTIKAFLLIIGVDIPNFQSQKTKITFVHNGIFSKNINLIFKKIKIFKRFLFQILNFKKIYF